MELCAMAVVVLLFIAVLKQFGILEPMSMEGNMWPPAPLWLFPGRPGVGKGLLPRLRRRPLLAGEGWVLDLEGRESSG